MIYARRCAPELLLGDGGGGRSLGIVGFDSFAVRSLWSGRIRRAAIGRLRGPVLGKTADSSGAQFVYAEQIEE